MPKLKILSHYNSSQQLVAQNYLHNDFTCQIIFDQSRTKWAENCYSIETRDLR